MITIFMVLFVFFGGDGEYVSFCLNWNLGDQSNYMYMLLVEYCTAVLRDVDCTSATGERSGAENKVLGNER